MKTLLQDLKVIAAGSQDLPWWEDMFGFYEWDDMFEKKGEDWVEQQEKVFWCRAESPRRYTCTKTKYHGGDHVGHFNNAKDIADRWSQ